eukprot:14283933-Alexandrium_andersonii.AAC.1
MRNCAAPRRGGPQALRAAQVPQHRPKRTPSTRAITGATAPPGANAKPSGNHERRCTGARGCGAQGSWMHADA